MNGKVFPVAQGRALAEAILSAKTPEEVKELSPWVKNSKKVMGKAPKELAAAGNILPPFHFNFRGTTVAHFGAPGAAGARDTSERGNQITLTPGWDPETVAYSVIGKFGDKIYLTDRHVDHIIRKRTRLAAQRGEVEHFETTRCIDRLPEILGDPDKVIVDPQWGENTLIYYRHIPGVRAKGGKSQWLAVVVGKGDCKHVPTMHPALKGTVKTRTGKDDRGKEIRADPVVVYERKGVRKWLGEFLAWPRQATW